MDSEELVNLLNSELLTVRQAARALGVTTMTVSRKIRSGQLEGVNINPGGNAVWRIRRDSLMRLAGVKDEAPVGG